MTMEYAAGHESVSSNGEPILYISCGVPGSGKTTFLNEHYAPNEVVISRDELRNSLLKPEESESVKDYFKKENKVFDLFVDKIIYNLMQGKNVYADATHLNRSSRNKLIWTIDCRKPNLLTHIEAIYFDIPIDVCIERNEKRKGTKAYTPVHFLRKMYENREKPDPTQEEFKHCWIVNKDGIVSRYF